MTADTTEIELKLALDEAALRRLPKLPIVAAHSLYKPVARRLRSTYFDTPDLALQRHGIGIRLRREGRRSLQTVKYEDASSAGLHQRREWEYLSPPNKFDFSAIDAPEVRDLLQRADLQRDLRAVFTTDFRRTQRILRFDSDEIELSIDRGMVRAESSSDPISEVELELKSGNVGRLFEVAGALNAALKLRLEPRSKAERGYRLFTGAQRAPSKAISPALESQMPVSKAFAIIVRSCLTHLQANEMGLLDGDDVEYLHQARVALRRLRSAITVFGALIPKAVSADVVQQLRWLTKELNDARNCDVFVTETLPPILQAHSESGGLIWLRDACVALQREQREHARAAVSSPRYQSMLLGLGAWLATHAWSAQAPPQALAGPIQEYAKAVLEKRHRSLRKRGKHLDRLTVEERHALRIAAKKLRYAADFFSHLFAKRDVQRYVRALANLQDVLGSLNDAATTTGLLEAVASMSMEGSVAQPEFAQRQQALGIVEGWVSSNSYKSLGLLNQTWQAFKQTHCFW